MRWITWSSLAPFRRCQGSCAMVSNGPNSSFISFNIRQGLKCWHVASKPTLTMWLLCSHPCPQGLNMFLSQQVFCSEHDKENLVLLWVKNLPWQKLKALKMRVLHSNLVCSHSFPKTSSDNQKLLFGKVCIQTTSSNHKVTSNVTGKLGYNFSFSRAFSKPKMQKYWTPTRALPWTCWGAHMINASMIMWVS